MSDLTAIIPTIYEGLHTVSREQVGFIPAVLRNPDGKNLQRAAKGQTINFPITPQGSLEDITPGQQPADSGTQTIGSGSMTISSSKAYPILWTGEEQMSLRNGDSPQINTVLADQFAQGFRTIANAVESDIAALYVGASRSVGTAGTYPFGTAGDLSDVAGALKIMKQNGAPMTNLRMVLGNSSAANLRSKQTSLFKVNEAGSSDLLRTGAIGSLQGFMVGESNQVEAHTAGTGSGYVTNLGATLPIGSTDVIVDTGSGTALAGDTVTFAGDDNQYVVTSGITAAGTVTIAEPGLKQTLADGVAMTIAASSDEQNMFFDRSSIVLCSRMPALPDEGDMAVDRTQVMDPVSGLVFEISKYLQYKQVKYEIALAWGVSMVTPEHSGIILA